MNGRLLKEMEHHHEGYDIESVSENDTRYIEVKSLSGSWNASSPAGLSKAQYEKARLVELEFWLYVVEYALSETPNIYRVQNPANRINQYLFDDGWIAVSNEKI